MKLFECLNGHIANFARTGSKSIPQGVYVGEEYQTQVCYLCGTMGHWGTIEEIIEGHEIADHDRFLHNLPR